MKVELQQDDEIAAIENIFKYNAFDSTNPLTIMSTLVNQDTLYLHQARKQSDWCKFTQAMDIEIIQHMKDKNFNIIRRTETNQNIPTLPAVWALS